MTFSVFFRKITSDPPGQRPGNYRDLCKAVRTGEVRVRRSDLKELWGQLQNEGVLKHREEWEALIELAQAVTSQLVDDLYSKLEELHSKFEEVFANPITVPSLDTAPPADHLGPWIMQPFHHHSFVFFIHDPSGRARDERALAELGFDIPEAYRKGMERRPVPMDKFKPMPEELDSASAVMFLGRFGLFGEGVAKTWGLENSRFQFISETRPEGLEPGMLDTENYHRLLVASGPNGRTRDYVTEQDGDKRIDYGLVQRYNKVVNDHSYTVVHVAGLSAPGSCAGARWVSGLFSEHEAFGPIPLPSEIKNASVLEAVVKVVAHRPPDAAGWLIQSTELMELYVDEQQWHKDERRWGAVSPRIITVVSSVESDTAYSHASVNAVWLDGKAARFHGQANAKKQFLSICRVAHQNNGVVSLDELKADSAVWGRGTRNPMDLINHIKRTVSDLKKRRFGSALVDEGDSWRLTATVNYEFKNTRPGGKKRRKV